MVEAVNNVGTMKSIANKLSGVPGQVAIWSAAWMASTAAHAARVNDLPGGPAVNQLNLHPPVTKIAEAQHGLHWMLLIICTVIFILVFGVMFYSIWKHRKSQGAKAATFHESVAVEVAWTVVPFLIVIGMALPATKVVVAQKDTTNADLTIKATGYQWKWGYDYINGEGAGIGFLSTLDSSQRALSDAGMPQGDDYLLRVDNPLVVPVGKKIRIITTANDVIHAWMVPAFGVKQDAIPGFVRDTWFRAEQTGDFYGQCAELCGKEHAYMPIHVKVLPQNEYTAWVEEQNKRMAALADDPNKVWTLPELVARGQKVYAANCAACHLENGKGGGAIKPLDGSQVVLHDPAEQMRVLLNGRLNGAMPSWKQLSDVELAAVAIWGKPTWGTYWNWDARLTSMLILLFLYFGLIALGNAISNRDSAAKACAVLAIVGVINIPIIKYSVEWWNTLHQGATFTLTEKPAMPVEMWAPLLLMVLGFYCFFGAVLLMRMRLEVLKREARASWVKAEVQTSLGARG